MEQAKTLVRTAVRTFFSNPKQILIIDALLMHSVLHIEDLAILLTSQPKDIRALISPLKASHLLSTKTRSEARVGSTRPTPREYYYIPFHPAIDAIKYRIAKLRKKVEGLYQEKESKRKDWRCPRCKNEYEELDILDKTGPQGFYCERCGATLIQNVAAIEDNSSHEKLRRLNTQLAKFDEMIGRVDKAEIPENDFETAWERKKEVPRDKGSGYAGRAEYVDVGRIETGPSSTTKRQELVDSKNLSLNLTSGAERDREVEAEKEKQRQALAKQNMLPVWHTQSAIGAARGGGAGVKPELDDGGEPIKKEDLAGGADDEKKIDTEEDKMQDEVAAYMAEMERERLERERKEQEESDEEDEDEDEFEDVTGTPMSSQTTNKAGADGIKTETNGSGSNRINGLKRELDMADDGSSVPSSDANTPASLPDAKRVKFENGLTSTSLKPEIKNEDADSDEDEDFEDV